MSSIIETNDFIVTQTFNGCVQIFNKKNGTMVTHMEYPRVITKQLLQDFANNIQNDGALTVDAIVTLIDAVS